MAWPGLEIFKKKNFKFKTIAVQPDTDKESEVSELQNELVTQEKSNEIKRK